jgi:hypothetical protein
MQQRFQFSGPHRKTFHGHRFDAYLSKRRCREIVTLVAGDERHIGNCRKFRFEFLFGVDALRGVGSCLKIGRRARDRKRMHESFDAADYFGT